MNSRDEVNQSSIRNEGGCNGRDAVAKTPFNYGNVLRLQREYLPDITHSPLAITTTLLLTLFSTCSSLLPLAFPLFSRIVVDEAIPARSVRLFFWLAVAFAGLHIIRIFIDISFTYVDVKAKANATRILRKRVFDRFVDLPMHVQRSREFGIISRRITTDVESYVSAMIAAIPTVIGQLVTFFALCVIIGNISPLLFALMAISIPSIIFINMAATAFYRVVAVEQQRVADREVNIINTATDAYVSLLSFGVVPQIKKIFGEMLQREVELTYKGWRVTICKTHLEWLFSSGVGAIALWVAWFLVLQETITLGWAIATIMYFGLVLMPVSRLVTLFQSILAAAVASSRLLDPIEFVTDSSTQMNRNGHEVLSPQLSRSILLENVRYQYPGCDALVLHEISLEIPTNQIIGISGPSGVGKTTLAKVIAGHLKPTDGKVYYPRDLFPAGNGGEGRPGILYLPSEVYILSASIRENISFFSAESNEEEIMESVDRACMRDFLPNLPADLDVSFENTNQDFSQGQQQRLMLGRALYTRPKVLILDESTSSVDIAVETTILENLKEQVRDEGLTVLFISHRDSVMSSCDMVFTLRSAREIVPGLVHSQ